MSGISGGAEIDHLTDLTAADICTNSEMDEVFLYFSNIEDPKIRTNILDQMKLASSVF